MQTTCVHLYDDNHMHTLLLKEISEHNVFMAVAIHHRRFHDKTFHMVGAHD